MLQGTRTLKEYISTAPGVWEGKVRGKFGELGRCGVRAGIRHPPETPQSIFKARWIPKDCLTVAQKNVAIVTCPVMPFQRLK
jgi:hypothetical protein